MFAMSGFNAKRETCSGSRYSCRVVSGRCMAAASVNFDLSAISVFVCREMPGELEKVMIWFRDYKIPDGKPANAYGYDSRPMNSDFAKMVIGETHELYNNLKEGKRENNGALALS